MSNVFELEAHARFRHERLLREAAEDRILRLARANEARPVAAGQQALAWAGRQITRWGVVLRRVGAPAAPAGAPFQDGRNRRAVGARVAGAAGLGC